MKRPERGVFPFTASLLVTFLHACFCPHGALAHGAAGGPSLAVRSLVAVIAPEAGTAANLLASGFTVVSDMERYLLVTATPAELDQLTSLAGARIEMLDRIDDDAGNNGPGYYVVTPADAGRMQTVGVRVLRTDGLDAVVRATPDQARALACADFEIARVFLRPLRPARTTPPKSLSRVVSDAGPADPRIEALVAAVSPDSLNARVQRLQDFRTRYALFDSCQAAANWIADAFRSFGIDSVYFHHWDPDYKDNVVAVIPGSVNPSEVIVLGGHYDSISSTMSSAPGADDDASGVAGVLECARLLASQPLHRTVVFIAFCGEEEGLLGSQAWAYDARGRDEDIIGMIELDMIGHLEAGDAMDLDVIRDTSSRWLRDLVMSVGPTYVPGFSLVDGSLPGRSSSDHVSFWTNGYNALLFFEDSVSYSHFLHTPGDVVGPSYNSPELERLTTQVALATVATLAEPLRVAIIDTPITDTADIWSPYRVEADIAVRGTLNPASIVVHYDSPAGSGLSPLYATTVAHRYRGFIPAMPRETLVNYWIEASDTEGNRAVSPAGAPAETHDFYVGHFLSLMAESFEVPGGWTVGAGDDRAWIGTWRRTDPNGTWSGTTAVQPEDDHTLIVGRQCWVTGNAPAGSGPDEGDVDGGRTTLFSPVFDLSSYPRAHLSYYRWYSNDSGTPPGNDKFTVDVSPDGGTSWVRLETVALSDPRWTLVERDLDDFIPLTSQVRLRFVAEDSGDDETVEAAVDDVALQIFRQMASTVDEPETREGLSRDGGLRMVGASPNPTTGATTIEFAVSGTPRPVLLELFDVRGRLVATLLEHEVVGGLSRVTWNGRDDRGVVAPAGVYFCRIEAGNERVTRKIALTN